nr:uncharacterized protein LOC111835905 [Paramormyrops kingsleyae]
MASMQDGVNLSAPPYSKVLLLGAIAAASAFVVTILIVLLCVGCQRKGKSNNVPTEGAKHRIMDMSRLRQSKLRSISKSDTKLHQMNKPNCNGKSASKSRPASMDLLLLPSRRRRSNSDLRSGPVRQLPQIPAGGSGDEREHTYSEVGQRSSPARGCPDDALYEMVGGRAGETDTPAPPVPANTPAPHSPEHTEGMDDMTVAIGVEVPPVPGPGPDPVTAEYACVRKVRKPDKPQRKDIGGGEPGEREQQRHSNTDLHHAPPPPHHAPPPPRNLTIPTPTEKPYHCPQGEAVSPPIEKPCINRIVSVLCECGLTRVRCFVHMVSLPSCHQEAVFMGNGEEYIWKPPEEDDLSMFQAKPPCPLKPGNAEGGGPQMHSVAVGVPEVYSKPGKPLKKKRPMPGSPPSRDSSGQRTLAREGCSAGFSVVVKPQLWATGGCQQDGRVAPPPEDPCYEAISEKPWPARAGSMEELDSAYEAVDTAWKQERPPNATLKPRKKKALLPPQGLPVKAPPNEALYDGISNVRQGVPSCSTTTIFTFNDGMEMYVTGL